MILDIVALKIDVRFHRDNTTRKKTRTSAISHSMNTSNLPRSISSNHRWLGFGYFPQPMRIGILASETGRRCDVYEVMYERRVRWDGGLSRSGRNMGGDATGVYNAIPRVPGHEADGQL